MYPETGERGKSKRECPHDHMQGGLAGEKNSSAVEKNGCRLPPSMGEESGMENGRTKASIPGWKGGKGSETVALTQKLSRTRRRKIKKRGQRTAAENCRELGPRGPA